MGIRRWRRGVVAPGRRGNDRSRSANHYEGSHSIARDSCRIPRFFAQAVRKSLRIDDIWILLAWRRAVAVPGRSGIWRAWLRGESRLSIVPGTPRAGCAGILAGGGYLDFASRRRAAALDPGGPGCAALKP